MYLCLYRKGKKYYFNLSKKLTEKFSVTNQNMDTVILGYKQKFKSFVFNGWDDFKRIKSELKKYGLRMYVAEVKASDKTFVKLIIELMNNPLYQIVLAEREETNEVSDDETGNVRLIELFKADDWDYAEKEFNFTSEAKKDVFTDDEL